MSIFFKQFVSVFYIGGIIAILPLFLLTEPSVHVPQPPIDKMDAFPLETSIAIPDTSDSQDSSGVHHRKLYIQGDGVEDKDGNYYKTIILGEQEWMAENLRTTRYRNGDPIPNLTNNPEWQNTLSGAWSYYNNESDYGAVYGNLYNWFTTIDDRGVCPAGWEVPTVDDWVLLETYLGLDEEEVWQVYGRGEDDNIGGRMKESASGLWHAPNVGANNASGFSALPGGMRLDNGTFSGIGKNGLWWSSTIRNTQELMPNRIWIRHLLHHKAYINVFSTYKQSGLSIRCVRPHNE